MDKKIQEIREALAEATQEDEGMTWIHADGEKAIEYISYLLQQIEIKDKVLEFYANRENWRQKGPFRVAEMDYDNGKCARAALKGEDTSE
ncbi:hypothetical protein G9G54_13620 [Paenibacillus sp. EKM212P]|uniref:hypothetical protein n=1 Tax=Paenibacillus sp. EKM212P TaxID=1683680 RepID=UPI0013ECA1A4|nr:hypothetical protein [Paenibacillus sp. EKM212P]KAF6578310.1 hypothetical protein G9G54_13620 [Paenibacillus sp. EKM212P]